MTIDERLDRLTERHEALTQTVEIMASMQQRNEEAIFRLVGVVENLVQVARGHERRISGLEGQQ